jgi:hypothetical protein
MATHESQQQGEQQPNASDSAVSNMQRSRDRWRLLTVALVCMGCGVFIGGMQSAPKRQPLQAIALDDSRSSGRWNSTLLAVDPTGKVYALDTTKPKAEWEVFMYSP